VRQIGRLSALAVSRARKSGYLADGGGLYLQIAEGGSKSWIFRYSFAGKRREMGLGPLGAVPLAQARILAGECRRLRAANLDPIEDRRAARSAAALNAAKAITFRACAEQYFEAHRPSWRSTKHAQQWHSTLATYVYPIFGSASVQAVDVALVLKALQPIWTTKAETASRVRGRIEVVLDWARARGYRQDENPARWRGHLQNLLPASSKVRRVRHHSALPYIELPTFVAALRAQDGIAQRALEFAILTAARTGEVRGARFDEIRGDVWTIPAERMKGNRAHRVPLSQSALAVVERMREIQTNDFLFPGRGLNKSISDVAMLDAMRGMVRPDGKPWADESGRPAVPHGLRSSFRDWCAERTAYPRDVAELALAHAIADTTEAAYRRGDALEKRRFLMRDWASFCASPVPVTGEVVAISHNRHG
jgi:integrase